MLRKGKDVTVGIVEPDDGILATGSGPDAVRILGKVRVDEGLEAGGGKVTCGGVDVIALPAQDGEGLRSGAGDVYTADPGAVGCGHNEGKLIAAHDREAELAAEELSGREQVSDGYEAEDGCV